MKLDKFSLVFEVDSDDFNNFQTEYTNRVMKLNTDPIKIKVCENKIRFWNERGFRKLVFSSKSLYNLKNYKVPKDIRTEVLRSLPNRKDIIQLDELRCIKYMKTETDLFFSVHQRKSPVSRMNTTELTHTFYGNIDLITGDIHSDQSDTLINEGITYKKFLEEFYGLFMIVVTYLELTPITLSIIKGGEKRGDIARGNHIKNESKSSVIQVNTNWNTRVIRIDTFTVRGHWRLQPYGKGMSKYKYIYIDMFEKGLLRRLSQKETIGMN